LLATATLLSASGNSCTVPDFVFTPGAAGSSETTGGGDGGDATDPSAAGVDNAPGGVGGAGGSATPCASDACAGAPVEGGAGGAPSIAVDDIRGLIAAYAFDERGTSFVDGSGNAHDGRIGAFEWVPGKRYQALAVDGAFGYVNLPASGMTEGLGNFTITLWVKPRSLTSWARLFDIGTGQAAFMTMTAAASTSQKPRFSMKTVGNATLYVDSSAALALDTWQLVSVTQAGDTVTLYIDGVVVGTSSTMTYRASSFAANQNYLGRSQFSYDPTFDGAFDEFRLYGRALSSAEIKSIAGGTAVPTGLKLSYDFDETEGTDAPEASRDNAKTARAPSGIVVVPGVTDSAIELDGAVGYVMLPDDLLDGVSDFTIACFVQQKQERSAARIFDFGKDGSDYIALMASSSSQKLRFGARFEGGVEQVLDTVPLTVGAWEHVAVSRAGSVVRVYVGGVEVGSRVVPGLPETLSTTSNWLGRSHRGDAQLNAALDDFRIYDRALSASEITTLARSALSE
jgi:hypothetical protein